MSISTGTRALFAEVMSWVAAAALCVTAFFYFDEVKAVSAGLLGITPPAEDSLAPRTFSVAETAHRTNSGDGVEIRANQRGHYHAEVEINGRPVPVLVDTGATMVSLTFEDAERAGIYLEESDFTAGVNTANGVARVAPVMLDRVSVGGITVHNVQGTVSERGRLSTTLLGMSFLGRLERVDMRSGVLLLKD
jgi:aspartyl protease family protein